MSNSCFGSPIFVSLPLGWHRQIAFLGRSSFALSTVSGSIDILPTLIRNRDDINNEWRNLPTLDRTKPLHMPPIASLEEARDLANVIAPRCKLDDTALREICWFGMGSLCSLVRTLRRLAPRTRPPHARCTDDFSELSGNLI